MLNKSIATSAMTISAMSLVLALSACSKKMIKPQPPLLLQRPPPRQLLRLVHLGGFPQVTLSAPASAAVTTTASSTTTTVTTPATAENRQR